MRIDLLEEVELDVVVVELLAHRGPHAANRPTVAHRAAGFSFRPHAERRRGVRVRAAKAAVSMPLTAEAVAPGSLVLGRYRPIRPLGSGGSGSVWLAREEASGRDVALKIVARDGNAPARAEREATAASRLRHERCLKARAFARDPGHVYIVYDYVPGRTLREAMRSGELTDAQALEAGAQILEALEHAHENGIVHRDVKPANVLLADGPDVSVKLFDFGLAVMHEEDTLTAVGDVPGTLAYISPERLKGRPAAPASDVWAAGVLLWEALAGRHPFWGGSLLDTARRIEGGAPSLAEARPDLDRRVVECVDRALSLDAGRRPTAKALSRRLRALSTDSRRSHRPTIRRAPSPRETFHATLPALAAFVFAAWAATALPFFPEGWGVWLGAVVALAALADHRLGLALALSVPVLPLGNYSLGLAALYAAAAAVWLVVCWREARTGLLLTTGPPLAAVGLLGVLPVLGLLVRNPVRRGLQVAAAVLAAAAVAAAGETRPARDCGVGSTRRGGCSRREVDRARNGRPSRDARPRRRLPAVRARARPVGGSRARRVHDRRHPARGADPTGHSCRALRVADRLCPRGRAAHTRPHPRRAGCSDGGDGDRRAPAATSAGGSRQPRVDSTGGSGGRRRTHAQLSRLRTVASRVLGRARIL